MDGGYVLYSILSIVFCALLMHGLKTMNHKLIMPSLIYIPLSSIGIVIACSVYAAAISVEGTISLELYRSKGPFTNDVATLNNQGSSEKMMNDEKSNNLRESIQKRP